MNDNDDSNILLSTESAIFHGLPYYNKNRDEIVLITQWINDDDPIVRKEHYEEILHVVLDSYPEIFNALSELSKTNQLPSFLIDYFNDVLRTNIDIAPEKETENAAFIIFDDRDEAIKRIGVVLESTNKGDRMDYTFNHDNYGIAKIGHLDFDKMRELKKKKKDSWISHLTSLCRGNGNIGWITKSDQYKILIKKSVDGWKYDYQRALVVYMKLKYEAIIHKLQQQLSEKTENIEKTLKTLLNDLGYDAAKFLHPRFKKRKFRKITVNWSDNLFIELQEFCRSIGIRKSRWKKRGRYQSLEPDLVETGRIIDVSYVSITYGDEDEDDEDEKMNLNDDEKKGTYKLYMDKIKLYYNKGTHQLTLMYTRGRQQINDHGQKFHV